MFFNNKVNRKKYVIFMGIAALLILCLGVEGFIKPIHLSNEKISKIFIAINISSDAISACGDATIEDEKAMKEVIGILNNVKVKLGKYSFHDLEGDSPSAWITIYDGTKEMDYIAFYYDIVTYNGNYYKISISQYDKLIDLCKQYGNVSGLEISY